MKLLAHPKLVYGRKNRKLNDIEDNKQENERARKRSKHASSTLYDDRTVDGRSHSQVKLHKLVSDLFKQNRGMPFLNVINQSISSVCNIDMRFGKVCITQRYHEILKFITISIFQLIQLYVCTQNFHCFTRMVSYQNI